MPELDAEGEDSEAQGGMPDGEEPEVDEEDTTGAAAAEGAPEGAGRSECPRSEAERTPESSAMLPLKNT